MTTESRPNDTEEHLYRGSLEPSPTPEKKKFSTKKKIASFMAGAALALMVVGGADRVVSANRQGNPTKTEAPANPGAEQQDLSVEAKAFVAEYGDRYSDPVSTFYANKSYEIEYGTKLVMSDAYISEYDTTAQMHETSPLGFERYMIPKNAKIDQELSMKIFNEYTSKELSLLLNCLAKNSTPEGMAIVDFEFAKYCSTDGNELMETAKAIVEKYGSAANYIVEPASNNSDNSNISYFNENDSTDAQAVDENGKITEFSSLTDLGITIESYSEQNFTQSEEIIKNFQLDIFIGPNPGYDSAPVYIGLIANP